MSHEKDHHHDQKLRQRKLEEEQKHHPHAPRAELHETADLQPHHRRADHVRHHHFVHGLKHHGKETAEEKTFIEHENKLHRLEMNRELCEDMSGVRQLKKTEKSSATPGLAKRGINVRKSISQDVAERITMLRLRIAFARAKSRERGEMAFGK